MSDCLVSQTNQANTQDWLNASKDLKITPYVEGYSLGSNINLVPCPVASPTSSFDWEKGAESLLGRYDAAWRQLASL